MKLGSFAIFVDAKAHQNTKKLLLGEGGGGRGGSTPQKHHGNGNGNGNGIFI